MTATPISLLFIAGIYGLITWRIFSLPINWPMNSKIFGATIFGLVSFQLLILAIALAVFPDLVPGSRSPMLEWFFILGVRCFPLPFAIIGGWLILIPIEKNPEPNE